MNNTQKIAKDWLGRKKYTRLEKVIFQYGQIKALLTRKFNFERKIQS